VKNHTEMKNRADRADVKFRARTVRRVAVLSATLAALAVPAVSAHAAVVPPRAGASVAAHSPSGTCVRATVLAFQNRHQLGTTDHLAEALGIALAHRHTACPALVDYLKQTTA
jgi:hypothetical protein